MDISMVFFLQPIHAKLINTANVSFLAYLQEHNMKSNEVTIHNNKHLIYVEKTIWIFSKIEWDENRLVNDECFSPSRHYNLLDNYGPIDCSMFQARDDKDLVFHFESLSFDVALYL
jgi:hypothetical protein